MPAAEIQPLPSADAISLIASPPQHILEPDADDSVMDLSPAVTSTFSRFKRSLKHAVNSDSEAPKTPAKAKKKMDKHGHNPPAHLPKAGFVEPIHIADSGDPHIVAYGNFRYDLRDSSYTDIEKKILYRRPNEPLSDAEAFIHYAHRAFARDPALDAKLDLHAYHHTIAYLLHSVIGPFVSPCVPDFFTVLHHPEIGRTWFALDDLQEQDPPHYRETSLARSGGLHNMLHFLDAPVPKKTKSSKKKHP